MNKLIIAAIIAGLSGNVFAGAGDVPSDAGNHDGTRVGASHSRGDGNDDDRRLFLLQSSAKVITGSQPEIGSASKYRPLFSDAGNH